MFDGEFVLIMQGQHLNVSSYRSDPDASDLCFLVQCDLLLASAGLIRGPNGCFISGTLALVEQS